MIRSPNSQVTNGPIWLRVLLVQIAAVAFVAAPIAAWVWWTNARTDGVDSLLALEACFCVALGLLNAPATIALAIAVGTGLEPSLRWLITFESAYFFFCLWLARFEPAYQFLSDSSRHISASGLLDLAVIAGASAVVSIILGRSPSPRQRPAGIGSVSSLARAGGMAGAVAGIVLLCLGLEMFAEWQSPTRRRDAALRSLAATVSKKSQPS